jgi:hypothetical protein
LLTAPFAVLATAFFFVISFLSIWRVCRLDAVPSYDGPSGGVLRKIREGLRVVVGDGSLRAVALATCVYQFSFAALIWDLVMLCTSGVRGSGTYAIATLIAINFLYGVFSQTVDVAVMAIRQAITPVAPSGPSRCHHQLPRHGPDPTGRALLGGAAAGALGTRPVLLVATIGFFLSPLCLLQLRRLGSNLPSRS